MLEPEKLEHKSAFMYNVCMIVYSKKIIRFIQEIKKAAKEILAKEVGLKVSGERFYDFRNSFSYPLVVVVYNNKSMLGYFNPDFYEMGFHESLMHVSRDQLHNIIRHELGHYLTFILHGPFAQAHGNEFKGLCQRFGWSEEVSRATVCLEGAQEAAQKEESTVLRKVQKLLALSTSSNKNEAELAMIKSQQLLLKHNLDIKFIEQEEEEKVYLKRILEQKKENAKMRSIGRILETFFVNTIIHRGSDYTYLEIVGTAVNLEIAEYVAAFLDKELDKQWDETRKEHLYLKGIIAKNSFFEGVAKGYCLKIGELNKQHDEPTCQSLMVIEKQLNEAKEMVYPHLRFVKRSGNRCGFSSALGESVGKQLSINPALHQSAKNSSCLLG